MSEATTFRGRARSRCRLGWLDRVVGAALRSSAAVSAGLLLLVVVFVAVEALPALRAVGVAPFFTDPSWHPAAAGSGATFGLVAMLTGTLATTAGAMALAAPAGLLSALFTRFYAPAGLAWGYRRLVELLAGIPSVVYGFWGLVVLTPLIARLRPPGASLLAGVLVLALMILPTVALFADAAFGSVPSRQLRGAAALGLSRSATVAAVLPGAAPGIVTGLLLATGRALGETMAVLMVCGNVVQLPGSPFDPVRTLTANIALEMAYALDVHRSALFVSGLLLLAAVVALVAAAEAVRVRGPGG